MNLTPTAGALVAAFSAPAHADDWQATLDAARGQTVYWNARGGVTAPMPTFPESGPRRSGSMASRSNRSS